jgi:hypothetical protein
VSWPSRKNSKKFQKKAKAKAQDVVYERPWPLRLRDGRLRGLKQDGICEDCLSRAQESESYVLDLLGNPRRHKQLGYNLSANCEGCGGTGSGTGVWVDITDALKRLTLKQKFVIERRYGLTDGKKYTQQEIADSLGVSQQAIAKHEKEAKQRLRSLVDKVKGCK